MIRRKLDRGKLFRNFKVSNKRRLWDTLLLKKRGKIVSKKVENWISEDPLRLFDALYNGHGLSLASDALKLFKTKLKLEYPEKFEEITKKRNARFLRIKYRHLQVSLRPTTS